MRKTIDFNKIENIPKKELESILKALEESDYDKKSNVIEIIKQELSSRVQFDFERLQYYTNFDQSDVRINFDEYDDRNTNKAKILARCHKDHIEIMARSFIGPFRYFENFIGALNHESIHPIVDRILLEDGHSYYDWDTEWFFYAGGMDLIDGLLYGGASPNAFLSFDAVLNTAKLIPEYAKYLKREYFFGDYDL